MRAAVVQDTSITKPRSVVATDAGSVPFEQITVTLTKCENIQLVADARYWKAVHHRAVASAQLAHRRHLRELERARLREASLRAELELARAQLRDLRQRVFGVKIEQSRLIQPASQACAAPRPAPVVPAARRIVLHR